MVFNEVASPRSGILQNIERESRLGLGTVSDNAAPDYYLDYFLGKTNEWLHIVNHWIHEIDDEWTFDDSNLTGFPIEVYNFTDDQQDYGLESDITKIRKIEVHDATKAATTGWSTIEYYLQKDRIQDLYGQDSSTPSKYFFQGRSMIMDVKVDTALIDKYRITYDRHAHEFVVGDTDAEAGFDKQFHWLLVYGPVMDWASSKHPDIYQFCFQKIFGQGEGDPSSLKGMLQEHYFSQNKDNKYKIGRKNINYS